MLLRDTHCFYDIIKYIDDTDSASDQSQSTKNLEAESKNIVKVTEKTKGQFHQPRLNHWLTDGGLKLTP